ncbi:hypothetical protein [Pararhodobacter oceanensis]|uniref:hypothetical protein n=1 Tax=Pararhodobacter oceanensis TaxID=2172121 RepID=UPI001403883C|nr:hypothetical protein [Pararhodobacter oceanensis]
MAVALLAVVLWGDVIAGVLAGYRGWVALAVWGLILVAALAVIAVWIEEQKKR